MEREQEETPKPWNLQKGMVGACWGGAAVSWESREELDGLGGGTAEPPGKVSIEEA